MSFMTGLQCMRCGQRYEEQPGRYVCDCVSNRGSDIGVLDVEYDYEGIRNAFHEYWVTILCISARSNVWWIADR